jgi:hypothetical protein
VSDREASPNPPAHDHLLRGWKDIATHLGVSVRTAQRLTDQLDLPVHRTGQLKGGVSAFKDELDSWVTERGATKPAGIQDGTADAARLHALPSRWHRWRAPHVAVALGLLVVLMALIAWRYAPLTQRDGTMRVARAGESPRVLPQTFRLRVRVEGGATADVRTVEGTPSRVDTGRQQVVFVEAQGPGPEGLHVVLYERTSTEHGTALVQAATADLKASSADAPIPVRFLLDEGWLELAWIDETRTSTR